MNANPRYQDKYRVASSRLPGWDYASSGYYFVTICTHNRGCFFGEITNGDMRLSPLGEIAHRFWVEIPAHTQNASLDEFIVMPNHVHGVIILHPPATVETLHTDAVETLHMDAVETLHMDTVETLHMDAVETLHMDAVETLHATSLRDATSLPTGATSLPHATSLPRPPRNPNDPMSVMSPHAGSLAAIIRSYKSAVSRWASHNERPDFGWQPRYYDHIIRNDETLSKVRQYIRDNPIKWELDQENPTRKAGGVS